MTSNTRHAFPAIAYDVRSAFVSLGRSDQSYTRETIRIVQSFAASTESGDRPHSKIPWPEIARGVIAGAIELGIDLEPVGRGIIIGAARAEISRGGQGVNVITQIARLALHETIAQGGNAKAMLAGFSLAVADTDFELHLPRGASMAAVAQGAHLATRHFNPLYPESQPLEAHSVALHDRVLARGILE